MTDATATTRPHSEGSIAPLRAGDPEEIALWERIGQEVADQLVELLGAHGVAVHLEATHLCTQMRGVRDENSRTWTSFWRGTYEEEAGLRDEFLRAAGHR